MCRRILGENNMHDSLFGLHELGRDDRCGATRDGEHMIQVQGKALSGNTWYECTRCCKKFRREPRGVPDNFGNETDFVTKP